jgi:hypothetical protein
VIYVTLRRFDIGGPLRIDLTRSPHRLAMTAICAFLPLYRDRRRAGIRPFETFRLVHQVLDFDY